MTTLRKLYMKLPLKIRKLIEKIRSPYTVIVHDADLKRKIVHYARSKKDALEWVGCYGPNDRFHIYHEGAFRRSLVGAGVGC